MDGVGSKSAAANVVNTPINTGGASAGGGLLSNQKDAKGASTDAEFGEVWKQIQAKYGAKAEKPREIKKTLGKDDFLRIMITQMKHQDPTQPFKAEQFAQELAQFTSVEQMQNMNQTLTKMANQNQPLERMAMTGLIGKTVTVDRERFQHTEGNNESLNFTLPANAKEVKITVVSDAGETIIEKDLGELKGGENTFHWDGLKTNTLPAKNGTYMLRVAAKNENGQSLEVNSKTKSRIVGVSFEGQEPVLLVGNVGNPDKITMKNVVRIENEIQQQLIPGAQSLADKVAAEQGAEPAMEQPKKNFITFQKGIGSANAEARSLPPEAAAALAKYQEQVAQAQQEQLRPAAPAEAEKGFANGLTDSDDSAVEAVQNAVNQKSANMMKGGEQR